MLVSVESCGKHEREIARLASIELHAVVSSDAEAATRIVIECSGESADIRVTDPLTSKFLERRVSLAGVDASARARTLAIAASELVSASWSELETNPEPRVAPTPPRQQPPKTIAKSATPFVGFEAAIIQQTFVDGAEHAFGGGARFRLWFAQWGFVSADVIGGHAEASRTPGSVGIDLVSAAVALGASTLVTNALRASLTGGVRIGWARILGTARASDVVGQALSGVWLGPELAIAVAPFPKWRVHPILSHAIGWAPGGVTGTSPGDRDIRVGGVWTMFSIGVAVN